MLCNRRVRILRPAPLSFLVVALAALLTTALAAQQPGGSQPPRRHFPLPGQQKTNAPPVPNPVTRAQTAATVGVTNSLAPSFSTAVYPSDGEYAMSVAAGDLNGDGWPDLAVTNECYRFFMTCNWDGGSVSVLMGIGGGGFSWPTEYSAGGTYTYGVAITDINGDGKLDVMVSNGAYAGGFPVGELLGNGDGTLQPVQPYASAWVWPVAGASVTVDVNGDGIPDLITLGNNTVNVQLGNGDGTYQPPISFDSGGVYAVSVTVADVNRDGKPDLLVANECANDDACLHSWSGTVGVLINATPYTATTTTLVSSVNPSSSGQAVTFTATVKPYSGTLPDDAFVTFKNGGTTLGTAPLVAGAASFTTAKLPVGTLNITASYAFDGVYGASVAPLSQVVKAVHGYATSLSLTASPNPASVHQGITFTAALTSTHGPIPDGEVITFFEHTTAIGAGITAGGVASFGTSTLSADTHTIKAVYPGDATFKSSSGTVQEVVTGSETQTFLTTSLNPSTYGQAVTFQASVLSWDPLAMPPSGTVKFVWDRFTLGSAQLSGSGFGIEAQASFTTSRLNADSYPLTAVYMGNGESASSTSDVLNQVVLPAISLATLTSSPNPSVVGQAVTLTAKITSPTVTAKGPVTFTAGKTVLGTGQLNGGKATLTTASLLAGTTVVTVTYQGDSNITKSTASIAQVVQ